MKTWIAILVSAPIVLGIAAWAIRPSKPPRSMTIAGSVEIVSDPEPETLIEIPSVEKPDDVVIRRKFDHEAAYAKLVADYDLRIQQLIASIDWTRAESRIRFPVEHDMIAAEFDRAVERLQD